MFRPRSASENSSVRAILSAEVATLCCDSGTIFGREVVPEVCRISAMSSGLAKPGRAAEPCCPPESVKPPALAFASGVSVRTAMPEFLRRVDGRGGAARFDDERLGAEIAHVEFEFVGAIGGVERRGDGARCDRDKSGRHFRAVRQDDRDAVVAADAKTVQRRDRFRDERFQAVIGQRLGVRSGNCDRLAMRWSQQALECAPRCHGCIPVGFVFTRARRRAVPSRARAFRREV